MLRNHFMMNAGGKPGIILCKTIGPVNIDPNSWYDFGYLSTTYDEDYTYLIFKRTVNYIPSYGFSGETNIREMYIPDSVTSIGNGAFWRCESLTSIVIPASVTSIKKETFRLCTSLTSITIPNSVTSIGDGVFVGCIALTSVTIGNSVSSIGEGAFQNCESLTSITIPDSVRSIEKNAFLGCSSLTSVVWNAKNCADFSSLTYAPFKNSSCPQITSFIFGDSVEYIPAYLCYDMKNLKSITIPNSVTKIGGSAFHGCSGLTSVAINSQAIVGQTYTDTSNIKSIFGSQVTEYIMGDSISSIGDYAFCECSSLTSITIPNSVTSIGIEAFEGCSSLTSITIPESVTSIGEEAFSGCGSLTSIIVEKGNNTYDSRENCNAIIETETNTLIAGCKNTIIPNSVTSIGNRAFYGCSDLSSITIPNSVTSIRNNAFNGCSGLTSITIHNSVKSIEEYAFWECSGLTSITIPNSVTGIGYMAFNACTSLKSITFQGSMKEWLDIRKGNKWNNNVPATVVQCTDGDLAI